MQRYLAILSAAIIMAFTALPALAANPPKYVPIIPEGMQVSGDAVSISPPLDLSGDIAKGYLSDFYTQPYLIVLYQGTHTDRYPTVGTNQTIVGDDKLWTIYFIKPAAGNNSKHYQFVYQDPDKYGNYSHPMQVTIPGNNSLDILSFKYDFANKKFNAPNRQQTSRLDFAYVIGSAKLSHPVSWYPGYDTLAGQTFEVTSYVSGGAPCHYNWWIGRKDIEQIPKPDDSSSSSPDSSSGGSSSGSGGNDSSSGGSSSGGSGGNDSSSGGSSSGSGGNDSSSGGSSGGWKPKPGKPQSALDDLDDIFKGDGEYIVVKRPGSGNKGDPDRYEVHHVRPGTKPVKKPDGSLEIDSDKVITIIPDEDIIISQPEPDGSNTIPLPPGDSIISTSPGVDLPDNLPIGKPEIIPTPGGTIHIGGGPGGSSSIDGSDEERNPPWNLFDPDGYDNYTPADSDPWGYDPLEGFHAPAKMPDFPEQPTIPPSPDPFASPPTGLPNTDPFKWPPSLNLPDTDPFVYTG